MNFNEEYKQVKPDEIKGKTVDKVVFRNRCSDIDEQYFIILFTDKTFTAVGLKYEDEWNASGERVLAEYYYVGEPKCYHMSEVTFGFLDDEGNLEFHQNVKDFIDLGLWNMTKEEVIERIKEIKTQKEDKEYKEYLRLKEKFENK